ncbi:CASP 4A4 [Olea europaea subsp. europaea]|uniref:CASP-like protein n=1 Tax=Olea europaea subsp. europaea TaxID=158383 RepID=A0A8S0SUJ9_OLEEU|nr:CASP 4A4 [Olea europaea subsp. europaea]
MSSVAPIPSCSPAELPVPMTPSPFSFSVATIRWSSRSPFQAANLFLRLLALVFSFSSALSLAAPSPAKTMIGKSPSFYDDTKLLYCFIVNILTFLYAAYQLFKGICDIAHRGVFISDMVSDYISFIFDQFAGYLLISSSSVSVPVIQQMDHRTSLWKAATVSVCMSFALFLVIATSALLSGYKICKRIIW